MSFRVTAPVKGFTGHRAGVTFADGTYEGELDEQAVAYFGRHGYAVEPVEPEPEVEQGGESPAPDQPTKPAKRGRQAAKATGDDSTPTEQPAQAAAPTPGDAAAGD